jgi:predicted PurR-regulated permease PerM
MERTLLIFSVILCVFAIFQVVLGIVFLVQMVFLTKKIKELTEGVKKEIGPVKRSLERLLDDGRDIAENAKYQIRKGDQTLDYVQKGLINATDGITKSLSILTTRIIPGLNTTYATAYGVYKGLNLLLGGRKKKP